MRILTVAISGVGGLADCTFEFPRDAEVALAGANGTGKSKFLACLLTPWTRQTPTPRPGQTSTVTVGVELIEVEREAIRRLSATSGWGEVEVPQTVSLTVVQSDVGGRRVEADPPLTVLQEFARNAQFLQSYPSLNVVYLPAERRLLPPRQSGIDLNQLSEAMAWQSNAATHGSVQNYGRLDDQEFEDFAKALAVAASLPSEPDGGEPPAARVSWEQFHDVVNTLISPKKLLPLTRQHPDQLRIQTPAGDLHKVEDLSSGERQALIIVSRVLRAGAAGAVVIIDEPDAYLHPHLSRRLMLAIEQGLGSFGQLIVATHSPAILDGVPPSAILRMDHLKPPRVVADESERIEVYRSAGFRASALTQSDLLIITEGEFDAVVLGLLFPELSSAAFSAPGGRKAVLHDVETLAPNDLPVMGVVDRDLGLAPVPPAIANRIVVWPTADIEGLFLRPGGLEAMIKLGLIKSGYSDVRVLSSELNSLLILQRDNVVAEYAQLLLVAQTPNQWPTPRGNDPITRLRDAVDTMIAIDAARVEAAIADAQAFWDAGSADLLQIVRGKYVLKEFANRFSEMKSGSALIEAVARSRPELGDLAEFKKMASDFLSAERD